MGTRRLNASDIEAPSSLPAIFRDGFIAGVAWARENDVLAAPAPLFVRPEIAAQRGPYDIQKLAQDRCHGVGLPYRRLGRRIFYKVADLDAEIERQPVVQGGES